MKKIIITESAEKNLVRNLLIQEQMSDKVIAVQKYLDNNFVRASFQSKNDDGEVTNLGICLQKDPNGVPIKDSGKYDYQVFDMLQNKFINILPKEKGRDGFLKQVLKDWYNNKISKNGSLSRYDYN